MVYDTELEECLHYLKSPLINYDLDVYNFIEDELNSLTLACKNMGESIEDDYSEMINDIPPLLVTNDFTSEIKNLSTIQAETEAEIENLENEIDKQRALILKIEEKLPLYKRAINDYSDAFKFSCTPVSTKDGVTTVNIIFNIDKRSLELPVILKLNLESKEMIDFAASFCTEGEKILFKKIYKKTNNLPLIISKLRSHLIKYLS